MQQTAKQLAEQLNKSLDDLNTPAPMRERAAFLGKMLDIPKQQALSLLEGHLIPDDNLLERIEAELEIDINMLEDKDKN